MRKDSDPAIPSTMSVATPSSLKSTLYPPWLIDRGERLLERGLPAVAVAAGLLLLAGPIISTAVRSLTAPDTGLTFSSDNFARLFSDRNFLEALRNTILSGLAALVHIKINSANDGTTNANNLEPPRALDRRAWREILLYS
jgi:hypothetical protein